MVNLQNEAQWRRAIIERRIEKVKAGSQELDEILDRLIRLENVEDRVVRGLVDAAVEEREARVRDFLTCYDSTLRQSSGRASDPPFDQPNS